MLRMAPFFLLVPLTTSCDSNITQYLATEDEKNSMEQLIMESQYEYDQGNFDDALEVAQKAYNRNPASEEANIQLGYIYLAKGGLDIFSLASGLIEESESSAGGDSTANLFATIGSVIGLTDTEIQLLTSGESTLSDITVYNPSTVEEARNAGSSIVDNLNNSIQYLCPFVDESAKLLDDGSLTDSRHDATNCPPSEQTRTLSAKSNFGFALAHLGEAVAFYSVLFYADEGQEVSNLQRQVNAIGATASTNTAQYISDLQSLTTTIDAVFPTDTDADGSMLNAVFNNLEVTSRSFAAVAGLPSDVTSSVTSAITNVKSKTSEVSSATSNSSAMKESFTKDIAKTLTTQINSSTATGSDLESICDSFTEITEGATKPSKCP